MSSYAKSFEDQVIENQDKQMIMLQLMMVTGGKMVVNIKDVARLENVGISTLRAGGDNRYLLPRFGESAYPTGVTRWSIEEYLAWHKKDNFEKQILYQDHLREIKKQILSSRKSK